MNDAEIGCPKCGGEATLLGALGSREHYRCRQCGWDWSEALQTLEQQQDAQRATSARGGARG